MIEQLNLIISYPDTDFVEIEEEILDLYKIFVKASGSIPTVTDILDMISNENSKRVIDYAIENSADEVEAECLADTLEDALFESSCYSKMEQYVFEVLSKYKYINIIDFDSGVLRMRFFGNIEDETVIVSQEAQNLLLRDFLVDGSIILANRIIVVEDDHRLLLGGATDDE